MNKCKTAVIMATYNGGKFIKQQLDSIRNQEVPPDYVFIADDVSTDDTVEVVRNYIAEFELKNWDIEVNSRNLGYQKNFFKLIKKVSTYDVDIVFFSDQDDIWYPEKNRKQIEILLNDEKIKMLSANFNIKLMSKNATVPKNQLVNLYEPGKRIAEIPFSYSHLSYRQGWTFSIKKKIIDEIAKLPSMDEMPSHDQLVEMISSYYGGSYNLNEVIGEHVRHENNTSGWSVKKLNNKTSRLNYFSRVISFYSLYNIFLENNGVKDFKIDEYINFYKRRVENLQDRKFFMTILLMMTKKKYYVNFSNWLSDFYFLFVK